MNKIRPIILAVVVVISTLLAVGVFTLPSPKGADYDGFSAERVLKDVKEISKAPHSVLYEDARGEVREYLRGRLADMGADPVVYQYDSLSAKGFTFNCYNILAEFAPARRSADPTYLMLVAHYDSRYPEKFRGEISESFGAADDAYGVGVILETLSQLLKDRTAWIQGVKVLFTDAEEVGMEGMKSIYANNPEVFDNVGLIVNLEARGNSGPALLFETSAGNEKVVDLYASTAKYKYTYSLTTVVYEFLPNFTDFTIVKDNIPGLNFSTIQDINSYHTALDNFDNVSAKSIQHYGEQILPLAHHYLVSDCYSDKSTLKTDSDSTNFTIPLLGFFKFSKSGYMWLNIAIFVLAAIMMIFEQVRARISLAKVRKMALIALIGSFVALAVGEGIAYLLATICGVKFSLFGIVKGIMFDNIAMVAMIACELLVFVVIYMKGRKCAIAKSSNSIRQSAASNAANRYAANTLYGAVAVMLILSAVLLFAIGENMMFFVPMTFAVVAMILYRLTNLKLFVLAAIFVTLLHAVSFLFALAISLTIGAIGAVMLIAALDFMLLIPMADIYLIKK